nr:MULTISPECIES: hypothetical protein [Rhodobacterales]
MWLYASLGDAYRAKNDHENALSAFQSANASGDGAMNAFVQFGLGVSLYDLDRKDEATNPLLRAYMMEGRDIFKEEPFGYLKHLADQKLID